jgi:hypothetical protein
MAVQLEIDDIDTISLSVFQQTGFRAMFLVTTKVDPARSKSSLVHIIGSTGVLT